MGWSMMVMDNEQQNASEAFSSCHRMDIESIREVSRDDSDRNQNKFDFVRERTIMLTMPPE
jgi:hypothetical protein